MYIYSYIILCKYGFMMFHDSIQIIYSSIRVGQVASHMDVHTKSFPLKKIG